MIEARVQEENIVGILIGLLGIVVPEHQKKDIWKNNNVLQAILLLVVVQEKEPLTVEEEEEVHLLVVLVVLFLNKMVF